MQTHTHTHTHTHILSHDIICSLIWLVNSFPAASYVLFYSLKSYYTLSNRLSHQPLLYLCKIFLSCTLYLWGFFGCKIEKSNQPDLSKKKKKKRLIGAFYKRIPSFNGVLKSPVICLSPGLPVSCLHSSCLCRKTYFIPWESMASNKSRFASVQVVILEERKIISFKIFCVKNWRFYQVLVPITVAWRIR